MLACKWISTRITSYVVVTLTVGFSFLLAPIQAQAQGDKLAPVTVITAANTPFQASMQALGTLRANEAVTLSASVTETVTAIGFDDGQRVKKGDVLVEMTSSEEAALVREAKAALVEAEKQLQRQQSLLQKKLTSQASLDESRQRFDSANARWSAVQSRLEDRLLIAPFDGVVGLRYISRGELVRPGDDIVTLDDDSVMKLDMQLPAVYLKYVKVGMPVQAKSAEVDSTFNGQLHSIDSRINPSTRSVIARALLPNPNGKLRPGMLMTVELTSPPVNILQLPEEALVQEGFNSFVYVLDEQTQPLSVSKQKVDTGARTNGNVVIEKGITIGQKIVTHGVLRLSNGSKVELVDAPYLSSNDNKSSTANLSANAISGIQ